MFQTTSLDIWRRETNSLKIITLNKALDRHLGNGIGSGITEFAGRSGSGKTQMCLQLCLTVQFAEEKRKAIFIDTNQGFNPYRLKEIASHCTERLQKIDSSITIEQLLNNIEYVYCKDCFELLASIEILKSNIKNNIPPIKLIIIDSFSFLLRNFNLSKERIQISYKILTDLQILADKYEIAVVITNELTTRVLDNDESIICPAFGDSHTHKIGQRILLTKHGIDKRFAYLEKTFHAPKICIPFEIRECGIRPPVKYDESVSKV